MHSMQEVEVADEGGHQIGSGYFKWTDEVWTILKSQLLKLAFKWVVLHRIRTLSRFRKSMWWATNTCT